MPRKKTVVPAAREQQVYRLAAYRAVVTIDYEIDNPPPFFQPGPGVVIVGDHRCGSSPAQESPNPTTESGPSLGEIREFQRRREEQPLIRKPFTSEDAAREAGLSPNALSFEAMSGIAATMPPVEESLVE